VKVRFTPSGRTQFLDALAYIRADSPAAAAGLLERAEAALRQLRDFPESGHALPEFPDLPHREVLVEPYRFFYRVAAGTVWIVGVWHGRQLPDEPEATARG
jgi:toxin ParE1/3/4